MNAFVAFTLVATLGLTWPQAMGVIVIEGVVISILVLTGFREAVLNAIPMDLKRAIGIGIGLFLAIIGLVNGGIVVNSDATLITLNPKRARPATCTRSRTSWRRSSPGTSFTGCSPSGTELRPVEGGASAPL